MVFIAPGTGGVAFVAGRKVGGAVQRNRSRRVMRAAWADRRGGGHEDVDTVLVARASILKVNSPRVADEIDLLLKQAGSRP